MTALLDAPSLDIGPVWRTVTIQRPTGPITVWALLDDPTACGCCGEDLDGHTDQELRDCAEACDDATELPEPVGAAS